MGQIEEMLVRNGLVMRNADGTSSYVEGSLVSNSLVVRNSAGWVTHRIERSAYGNDLIVINTSTGAVEARITTSILF